MGRLCLACCWIVPSLVRLLSVIAFSSRRCTGSEPTPTAYWCSSSIVVARNGSRKLRTSGIPEFQTNAVIEYFCVCSCGGSNKVSSNGSASRDSAQTRQTLADLGQLLVDVGQSWSKVGDLRPAIGRGWLDVGRCWPNFGQLPPRLVDISQILPNVCLSLAGFCPIGPTSATSVRILRDSGQVRLQLGQHQHRQTSVEPCPMQTKFVRHRQTNRPMFVDLVSRLRG